MLIASRLVDVNDPFIFGHLLNDAYGHRMLSVVRVADPAIQF